MILIVTFVWYHRRFRSCQCFILPGLRSDRLGRYVSSYVWQNEPFPRGICAVLAPHESRSVPFPWCLGPGMSFKYRKTKKHWRAARARIRSWFSSHCDPVTVWVWFCTRSEVCSTWHFFMLKGCIMLYMSTCLYMLELQKVPLSRHDL